MNFLRAYLQPMRCSKFIKTQQTYSMFSFVIYFIHSINTYICQPQFPNSPHLSLSLLVSIHLFSTSMSLFLLCKQDHLQHFSRFDTYAVQYREFYLIHCSDLNGKEVLKVGRIYVYLWLSHFVLQQKLTQCCKSTILQ